MRGILPGIVSSVVLGLVLGLSPALAQDKPAPPLPTPSTPVAPDTSILSFLQAHPDCTELTDECLICAVVGGKAMCSTPGIACVRKDLRCVTTKPPTPKQ
ncbi:hypothetical protein [Labrys monachus]|uniref:Uncharacterized protein n=1 Tax=Labrys monachus TaxID=217067 RepID=A0ABU0FLI1_9HYPH|nr:hypothetical protein [Labrys monachus]MDQ0394953.1 hypothetical protein [Labrys monachus]